MDVGGREGFKKFILCLSQKNRKKVTISIICPKGLYLQRNPQLYSCVCCIKESWWEPWWGLHSLSWLAEEVQEQEYPDGLTPEGLWHEARSRLSWMMDRLSSAPPALLYLRKMSICLHNYLWLSERLKRSADKMLPPGSAWCATWCQGGYCQAIFQHLAVLVSLRHHA